jgi:AraC-like DNA-binding protein
MSQDGILDRYKFTTVNEPGAQRFDAWAAAISTCDYERPLDSAISFDAEFQATRFGPFVLAGRSWLRPEQQVLYRTIRSTHKIRTDQIDHYHLVLQLSGSAQGEWARSDGCTRPGGLYLYDMSKPFDCMVTTGDTVGLVIPRDLFQSLNLRRYGDVIDRSIGAILTDHLISLQKNIETLRAEDIPYVIRATHNLLRAAITRSPDSLNEAKSEIDVALIRYARKFIEANLMRPDLSPEMIGAAIGASRAKLYQLFRSSGGVMREVQRQRLERAYEVLSDPVSMKVRISDVAWQHGFADEKYFSRVFRQRFGMSPRDIVGQARAENRTDVLGTTRKSIVGGVLAEWLGADVGE